MPCHHFQSTWVFCSCWVLAGPSGQFAAAHGGLAGLAEGQVAALAQQQCLAVQEHTLSGPQRFGFYGGCADCKAPAQKQTITSIISHDPYGVCKFLRFHLRDVSRPGPHWHVCLTSHHLVQGDVQCQILSASHVTLISLLGAIRCQFLACEHIPKIELQSRLSTRSQSS